MEEEVLSTEVTTEPIIYMTQEQFNQFMSDNQVKHVELLQQDQLQHTEILDALSSLNGSVGNIPSVDNTELVAKMDEFISTINSLSDTFAFVDNASSAIITYSVFYIPLLIIVWVLWWFFKQFIR